MGTGIGRECGAVEENNTINSLADEFLKEQARCRGVQQYCRDIGLPGRFLVMVIEEILLAAEKAAMSGDVAEMLASFKEMQGVKS